MVNFKKSNKSSIIRVIISNFDDQYIKEIKVLYKKQGGVDTFKINKMSYDDTSKDIVFEDVENKSKYIDINKNCFEVTKRDKYSNKEVRKYRLSGKFQKTKEGKILVTVCVEDYLMENLTREQIKKKVGKSSTERLLLSKEIIKNYSDLADCSEDEIDSQKIYKVNKFLSYRSNMLIYFNFINNFLIKGTDYQEIWEISSKDREEVISQGVNNFQKYSHKFIENHNNYAKKQNQKIEENKWKDRDKIPELNVLANENIHKDVEKIIEIFIEFRHNIMHYKYSYFEKLFTGGDIQVSNKNLTELLDLNIFQEMLKIRGIKEDKITNYLEERMELRILGKSKNAKKAYNIYYKICNRKNGFNSFINSLFTVDGEENKDVKKEIENQFLQRKEFLLVKIKSKKAKLEKIEKMKIELKEMEEIFHLVGSPYI
ncbi:MAG: type VI-C CRISPR-associated RNA-guided ribonuclease Cas13c, partial [Psychrilyobacter sp.]|uniref:type VI-C CRISPR-associated RNA-guided ribonuclease Cas13c n=1 Tax=Psychrilyobacter sp. TaxID=2586924 RepID=UPI003C70A1E1